MDEDDRRGTCSYSSRIRLARNLENHVHPLMFPSEQEGFRVINEVQDALQT